jgi:hypothetical protein
MRSASNEEAGSAATLSGLTIVTAGSPTNSSSANNGKVPEGEASEIDVGLATIDGADLLDRVHQFLCRFIVYPSPAAGVAHVLWIAHTHLMNEWFSTPRLAVLSPDMECGKSRVFEITSLLVPRPILDVNTSAAFLLRSVADQENRPTLLLDEIDTIYGDNGKGSEPLRGLLNSGYRRGATTGRCETVGKKIIPVRYPTYAAVGLGGIGELPDTIMSRAIVIRMRRALPTETVEPFRPRLHEEVGMALRDELVAWTDSLANIGRSEPVLPDGFMGRKEDIWIPLLCIADAAGQHWPELARTAAISLVTAEQRESQPSERIELLLDIRKQFGERDKIASEELVSLLLADEEAPWGDLAGRKLDQRKLAKMLKQFRIRPKQLRFGNEVLRGYEREAFTDAWLRYLPALSEAATSGTSGTSDTTEPVSGDCPGGSSIQGEASPDDRVDHRGGFIFADLVSPAGDHPLRL